MLQVLMANLSATLRSGSTGGGNDHRAGGSAGASSLRVDNTPKLLGDQGYQLKHEVDACVSWHCIMYSCART